MSWQLRKRKKTRLKGKKGLFTSQVAHKAGALLKFPLDEATSLGILPLLPGWDASPSQGYPQYYYCWLPFIHLGEEKQCGVKFIV